MRLGLVVNPIAGMGGRVALKGSDDPELLAVARARGAEPAAPARAVEALRAIAAASDGGLVLFSYAGEMGELEARAAGLDTEVLFLLGEESPDWARASTDELRSALPGSRVAVLRGQGHAATLTAPELVAGEITRFLDGE